MNIHAIIGSTRRESPIVCRRVQIITTIEREAAMMNRRLGRIGIVRRELVGKACSSCGGRTYQLTYHGSTSPMAGLAARCTHCQQARGLGEDLGRVLWV
jgi:hypothetical protein